MTSIESVTVLGIKLKVKSSVLYCRQQYWKLNQLERLLQHTCKQNEALRDALTEKIWQLSNKEDPDKKILEQSSGILAILEGVKLAVLSDEILDKRVLEQNVRILAALEDFKSASFSKKDSVNTLSAITVESCLERARSLGDLDLSEVLRTTGNIACSVRSSKAKDMLLNIEYLFGDSIHIEHLENGDYSADLYILWEPSPMKFS